MRIYIFISCISIRFYYCGCAIDRSIGCNLMLHRETGNVIGNNCDLFIMRMRYVCVCVRVCVCVCVKYVKTTESTSVKYLTYIKSILLNLSWKNLFLNFILFKIIQIKIRSKLIYLIPVHFQFIIWFCCKQKHVCLVIR